MMLIWKSFWQHLKQNFYWGRSFSLLLKFGEQLLLKFCLKKKVAMQDDVDVEVFLTTFEIKFLLREKFLTAI